MCAHRKGSLLATTRSIFMCALVLACCTSACLNIWYKGRTSNDPLNKSINRKTAGRNGNLHEPLSMQMYLYSMSMVCPVLNRYRHPHECKRSRKEMSVPRSLLLFASISTTNRQDRDIRQRDAPTSVTSFVATSYHF
ncbi:unnamed protein product [Ixodes persulcatus]